MKMSDKEQEGENVVESGEVSPQETIRDLKRAKATAKTAFTKVRRYLLTLLQRPDINREAIEDGCRELDQAQESAMEMMENLGTRYKIEKDHRNAKKLSGEIEQIEIKYSEAQNRAQQVIDTLSNSRVYNKFLHVLLNRKGEVLSEQTESHQTPHQSQVTVTRICHQL